MNSMTGYGRGEASTAEGCVITLEAQSVNKRNLEVQVSMPREWMALERDLQALVRARFDRGRIHLMLQASRSASGTLFAWDESAVAPVLERLRASAAKEGIRFEPDAALYFQILTQLRTDTDLPPAEVASEAVLAAAGSALTGLASMRAAEGASLGEDLLQRGGTLGRLNQEIAACSSGAVARYRELLMQRLRQAGLEIDVEDERVLREIALFADRCDVSEEITRLGSHLKQYRAFLDESAPVGRKLEFLLQEINREFNTIGSKSSQIEISRLVVEAKNELERIREQVQNLE